MTSQRHPGPRRWARRLATLAFRIPLVQRRWGGTYQAIRSDGIPWTPLGRPLARARVALVTTAGVHLASDRPFDMSDPQGDASLRIVPSGTPRGELTITHDYYDHRDAERDINVVFPIDVLGRLHGEGRIGSLAGRHYSLMGHLAGPHLQHLIRETAPELAAHLKDDGVDVALFTPA
jgi:D-proline reductase (dithiol) PrdB